MLLHVFEDAAIKALVKKKKQKTKNKKRIINRKLTFLVPSDL